MNEPSDDNRPVTVGDVKQYRRNLMKGGFPLMLSGGILLFALGIFFLLVEPAGNTSKQMLLVISSFVFGILFIGIAFWAKNKSKNL